MITLTVTEQEAAVLMTLVSNLAQKIQQQAEQQVQEATPQPEHPASVSGIHSVPSSDRPA